MVWHKEGIPYVHFFTIETKRAVITKYGTKCFWCGFQLTEIIRERNKRQRDVLQIGHVEGEAKGGKSDLDNLRPCCPDCNLQQAIEKKQILMAHFDGDIDAIRWFKCKPENRTQLEHRLRYIPFKGWKYENT